MADVDPETLLEWLSMGQGDERDMQLIALEQLCMLLLMSDNVDRCFEWYVIYIYINICYFNLTNIIKNIIILAVPHAHFFLHYVEFFWMNLHQIVF